MRIACSTSAFKTDLDETLKSIADLGFSEVDLIAVNGWDHVDVAQLTADYATESARVKNLLEKHRLTPIAMNFGVHAPAERDDEAKNAERSAQTRAVCRLMRDLGILVASFYPGYYDGSQSWSPPRAGVVKNTLISYREMLAIAKEVGVIIGPEIHYWTAFQTPSETRELLEAIPELTIAYDPSHFALQRIDLTETEFLLDRTHHVHLRGAGPDKMQAPFASGSIDYEKFTRVLQQRNYAGDFSIEYLPDFPGDVRAEIQALHHAFAKSWEETATPPKV